VSHVDAILDCLTAGIQHATDAKPWLAFGIVDKLRWWNYMKLWSFSLASNVFWFWKGISRC
jgi:hypothetical protein